ncbi:biotin carboxylase subunit-acetyl CoA carboxylase [Plasmodium inui San Antonio 1]|uniref:Biotin carboxylase subunit-acetyl CoA carboxylase n=1 Tax=Plasmodium inui San Antonio 1 TaxID=1237626 RepID=W7AK68_9APIC|nr:biotin carboxylase subunit-acetyl CoA carboxylase [Plasmodium inui San Antonio 1]EUD69224.1 biotin carboxylase subunit-acetyl CoA carboxylase [Plasmodium inui San Antonio 1]
MVNGLTGALSLVLLLQNLVEPIKHKSTNCYIHMHNNANRNNFINTERREAYQSRIEGTKNILHESSRSRYVPLFVSKGTELLNSFFFKNNRRISRDKSTNISKNGKKSPPSSFNESSSARVTRNRSSNGKKWDSSKDIAQERVSHQKKCTEQTSAIEELADELLSSQSSHTDEDFISVTSNDHQKRNYSPGKCHHRRNMTNESGNNDGNSHMNKVSYSPGKMCDVFSNWDIAKATVRRKKNVEDNFTSMMELIKESSSIHSKRDAVMIPQDRSGDVLTDGRRMHKGNVKKRKKHLNRLYYSFRDQNDFLSRKEGGTRGGDECGERFYAYRGDNHAGGNPNDVCLVPVGDSPIRQIKPNLLQRRAHRTKAQSSHHNGIDTASPASHPSDSTDFLTYEEKQRAKEKAHQEYIRYIEERRYPYFNFLKYKNGKIIKKLLIANNGMAATKCILSIKEWLFKSFSEENLMQIIVLATEEDISSNAKYISLADKVIKVPPGKNINNYANVPLIVDIAKKEKVDAVWPGWGHCSENPLLSTMLERENIIFIGPTGDVMEALGDKISANILAQSVNVPVVKWSGDTIRVDNFDKKITQEVYNKSTIHSLDACIKECQRIGYPVMIKASQGGGGKGIRKVENEAEIEKAYAQVQIELPNSPIFLMKVCSNVRHIEIQVVGDMYGNVCSLSGRDCTTQRRFQKIFEEGPPSVVPPDIFREMEKASIRLTKMIKYRGAGTIEYLYDQEKQTYFFLELNPRLQVEHPVSEGITNTNLISIQLQVAMGIPLQNIDDIRRLYRIGEWGGGASLRAPVEAAHRFGAACEYSPSRSVRRESSTGGSRGSSRRSDSNIPFCGEEGARAETCNPALGGIEKGRDQTEDFPPPREEEMHPFDFYNNRPHVSNHVIAARITAENSNDSFKPTSGKVKRIHFQNSNDVWGYFSIDDGSVHEFSDSQIGHIFAKGETREVARKNLILALRKLNIEGEIKTGTKYLAKILECKPFIENNITTNWLDTIIEKKKNIYYNAVHIIILCATIFKLLIHFTKEKEDIEDALSREDIGIKPQEDDAFANLKREVKNAYTFDIVFENVRYNFKAHNTGENLYTLKINEQEIEVLANYDKKDNKIFASFLNHTYLYTCSEDSLGIHMHLEKDSVFIPKMCNPFHLVSNTNGKIVKYLIKDGEEVKKNEDYIEVEAMKMIMTFKSTEKGILRHRMSEGTIVKVGDLLGVIEETSPDSSSKRGEQNQIKTFTGHLDLSNKYAYELEEPSPLPHPLKGEEVPLGFVAMDESAEGAWPISDQNGGKSHLHKGATYRDEEETLRVVPNDEPSRRHRLGENTGDTHVVDAPKSKDSSSFSSFEQEETSSREGITKNRLFLKQRKNIFRLFASKKASDEKEHTAVSYANEKFNSVKAYLTSLSSSSASSAAPTSANTKVKVEADMKEAAQIGEEEADAVAQSNKSYANSESRECANVSSTAHPVNDESGSANQGSSSLGSGSLGNISTGLNASCQNSSPSERTDRNDNVSSEVVSTRNISNEKASNAGTLSWDIDNKGAWKSASESASSKSASKSTSEATSSNCTSNSCTQVGGDTPGVTSPNGPPSDHPRTGEEPRKKQFLLDIPNMKRVEYLLKGYEQDYQQCFNELVKKKKKNNINANFIYILDKFIEYNSLFAKKENITQVEAYDILHSRITNEKKKKYEIAHAYTYNYLSIKFVELVLKYLLDSGFTSLSEMPEDLLERLKKITSFRGKPFGNIILLARAIVHIAEHMRLVKFVKDALNDRNANFGEKIKQLEENIKIKKRFITHSRLGQLPSDASMPSSTSSSYRNHCERVVNTFLGSPSDVHMFLPSLFTPENKNALLEIYAHNLYKHFDVKTELVGDDCLKFFINNSEEEHLLILNEKSMVHVDDLIAKEGINPTDRRINSIHIINTNESFPNDYEASVGHIKNKCKHLYIYHYFGERYGDVYEWVGEDDSGEEIYSGRRTNLLPYQRYIFSFEQSCQNYDLESVDEKIFNETKVFLGRYKKNNKIESLFAERVIHVGEFPKGRMSLVRETPKKGGNTMGEQHLPPVMEQTRLQEALTEEFTEAVNDITIARLNPKVHDAKVSSYITYHVVLDEKKRKGEDEDKDKDQLNTIEEALKNFLNRHNELLLENYVNDVYICVYRKGGESSKGRLKLTPRKILRLHVLFDGENNVIEEVESVPPFDVDALYLKRKRARDIDTLYAYDFVKAINISLNRMNLGDPEDLFTYVNSVREFKLDLEALQGGGDRTAEGNTAKQDTPHMDEKDTSHATSHLASHSDWLFLPPHDGLSSEQVKIRNALYLSDKLNVGQNKLSVIGLLMNVRTIEYKEGRDVIFIINDITTHGGSFSVVEDQLFYAISSYAREKKIPRIYISCNSGARIGLYPFLMDKIQVSWKDEKKKELGYDYIYITEEVKNRIAKEDIIFLKEILQNGEKRYLIEGIVGNLNNHIGVENLRGSGLIAGETSKAYDEIFTLSYVTGRSVGIGAYLVRLGKRTIQKKGSSLLLTGFNALNKILGEKVYISNEQLGGVKIMLRNGISQLEAQNDQDGVDKIFKWLSYVPKTSDHYYDVIEKAREKRSEFSNYEQANGEQVHTVEREASQSENKPTFKRKPPEMYFQRINDIDMDNIENADVVDLIRGTNTKQGFLDKNSYFEYMNEWGKGIITGRGKLGSIPVGVIAVNRNLVTQVVPCDPALKTKAVRSTHAPCVFFPDNSYKTAQSIEDFNKENLPLFVFANWRGFSGGTMDMFNSVLKFGSMIVNQLVNYKHAVFVYIPIWGELRGGSWVVVDETLNSQIIEMYADTNSKGGILEPPGIVEVKFRLPEIRKLMHGIDSSIISLDKQLAEAQEDDVSRIKKQIEDKEKELLPFYLQVCHRYADLHDVSKCMKSKGVIRKIVPWEKARSFFYYRLVRRLLMSTLSKKYGTAFTQCEEFKKLTSDIASSDEDDYEVCRRILNESTLRDIERLTEDLHHQKTLDEFYKAFQRLPPQLRRELFSKLSSHE